jgi:hypothetical protein
MIHLSYLFRSDLGQNSPAVQILCVIPLRIPRVISFLRAKFREGQLCHVVQNFVIVIHAFCYPQIHLISHGKVNLPSAFIVSLLHPCLRQKNSMPCFSQYILARLNRCISLLRIEDEPFSGT